MQALKQRKLMKVSLFQGSLTLKIVKDANSTILTLIDVKMENEYKNMMNATRT